MKKVLVLLLALMMCVGVLSACGNNDSGNETPPVSNQPADDGSQEPDGSEPATGGDYKVAAIFGGAINDGNWNETQYNGLVRIGQSGATINYMENVGDADAAEAARTYAAEGYDLIYLTTNSYQDYCTSVAADFPDVKFVQINGTAITDNFISVRIADEEQGFMQGVVAALLTEAGKVGFVGGQEINPIILGSSGFQQGVDYVNATYGLNVEAMRINTGNFTDVNQAKETAISMIESGCDVITPMANDASVGVMEAAEEKGIMAIGCGLGQDASAPTTTQIIVVKDVAIAYDSTYADFVAGNLSATEVETFGVNRGVVYITDWFVDADSEVVERIQDVVEKMVSGELTVDTN